MASRVRTFLQTVSTWPHISVHSHQFEAQEFRFDKAEVGHVHLWGTVDIPFPRAIRDALLEEHLAERHRWVPDSGWITFRIRNDKDLEHALWLMRLSYLRYALKSDSNPLILLEQQIERLHLNPKLATLLAQFVPARTRDANLVPTRDAD
jgi:hypothetical protein